VPLYDYERLFLAGVSAISPDGTREAPSAFIIMPRSLKK
jgi:hypothetical protein